MENLCLAGCLVILVISGYFIIKRIGAFLEENCVGVSGEEQKEKTVIQNKGPGPGAAEADSGCSVTVK